MSYKIIVIEDDPIFTFLLEKGLKATDITGDITLFTNGLTAINFLKEDYNNDNNYVVFLDLNMPVMNGWKFMEHFEVLANPSNCMVFVLTSSGNKLDIDNLMASPLVTDFVIKPINDIVFKKIKNAIQSKFGE
ncbi:two-component system response regulator [Maribacter sp. MAR_2009_72]|uniref:response regulator n=1 Tax=Maribacter sp. MAR_2009_72 TaxID=1250050 RepID=UPI00119BD05F|nr:response regulator [Maribacter sp. MAR_2009_72]TVZ15835.1 CheY-like chemotaxis protein [Maribacter sp. MAR_2009_72]